LESPTVTINASQTSFSSFTIQWSNINAPVDFWIITLRDDNIETDVVRLGFSL